MKPGTHCLACGRRMPTFAYWSAEVWPGNGKGYDGNGYFCTLRCGYRWALRQVRPTA